MCGIAGIVQRANLLPPEESTTTAMLQCLAHRGPDASGLRTLVSRTGRLRATLLHRRLSIIDLAGGAQPFTSDDESVVVVFNGEIYNYRELRSRLQAAGHVFRSESDTEVLVYGYKEFGVDVLQHLRGMFALAIWDVEREICVLARDRLGQKPLFYRHHAGQLDFASELKALLQLPHAPRSLDPAALDAYLLYQYVPAPHCILKGYHKLPPGCRAVFDGNGLAIEPYWHPPYEDSANSGNASGDLPAENDLPGWSSRLRDTLTTAVQLRLRSDVPLGGFLSGGIDSTIIVGLMQQLSPQPVKTFSIGFDAAAFDERQYARLAAGALGTEHHELIVQPDVVRELPRLIWHYDEPFADSSAIPTMALSRFTRDHVKVALSGDGGDELFAGYDRYRAMELADRVDRLPALLRKTVVAKFWRRLLGSARTRSRRRRLRRFLEGAALPRNARYRQWMSVFDDEQRRDLYTPAVRTQVADGVAERVLDAVLSRCLSRDGLTQVTCADVLTYLPGDILTKVDLASMSEGLECRSPFLDHHVVELAARMPMSLKRRGRVGKWILSETFSDLLPGEIRTRRKMGFGVPLDDWFRGALRPVLQDVLLAERTLARNLFRPEAVHKLLDDHLSGRADHSHRLWALLCFELWARQSLDTSPPLAPPEGFEW